MWTFICRDVSAFKELHKWILQLLWKKTDDDIIPNEAVYETQQTHNVDP